MINISRVRCPAGDRAVRGILLVMVGILGLYCTSPTVAADRPYTAVTPSGISKMGAIDKKFYVEVLQKLARDTVTAFLSDLRLPESERNRAVQMVSFELLGDESCLASAATLFGLRQVISGGECAPPEGHLISSIILPYLFVEEQRSKIRTNFFPYTLKSLQDAEPFVDNVFEYDEFFPAAKERTETTTLIVLGFLNLYWETVKDKEKLTKNDKYILQTGLRQYAAKLNRLCGHALSKGGCLKILAEINVLIPIVESKEAE